YPEPGTEFLFRKYLRISYCRGGSKSHYTAGFYPGTRIHLRGILPFPGYGCQCLRPEPFFLLFIRYGSRIRCTGKGGPPHLEQSIKISLRSQRTLSNAEISHSDIWPFAARSGN